MEANINKQHLLRLRKSIRQNAKSIVRHTSNNYLDQRKHKSSKPLNDICLFCSNPNLLTKEHIIPRWIFEKDTKKFFEITINGQNLTFNKATIPACQECNSVLLNEQERYVQSLFNNKWIKKEEFTSDDLETIIRWLETIDYKFQILNLKNKFLRPKNKEFIPFLKDIPLYLLLPNRNYSEAQISAKIRKSLLRISIKNKQKHFNSLVLYNTSNKNYHFFHTIDEFIFIEIPKYQIAIFYFYSKVFENELESYKASQDILDKVY